eukprot:Plantae.Rhodophyta-Hildenbrandia_rubra.ctg2061.p1 GENE.Plantae.Rhodophyta-Hildenbrandia_rubra.ctg2061~~Plantae.Rhodophyta-Hildenbrandia_rubra.ctg2061.p1  ORF type:complete len:374 (+),score=69.97 Plantae.Rhodophyta-Hildenbrandia_rubra.ctg2061:462-1583(+)
MVQSSDTNNEKTWQGSQLHLQHTGSYAVAKTITFSGMGVVGAALSSALQENFASLVAGGVAGTVSASVMSPIDVVRIHLQATKGGSEAAKLASGAIGRVKAFEVAKNIARIDGMNGFFRGLGPTLVGMLPHRSSQFWAYSTTRGVLNKRFGEKSWVDMVSAAVAGIVANTVTNPIWLVKARIQLQAGTDPSNPRFYKGYRDAIARIWKEEGVRGFYKGVTASYWGITESAIQFVVYEKVKRKIMERNAVEVRENGGMMKDGRDGKHVSSVQTLCAAAFSKFVASLITYPHEVVRTRMREQPRFLNALPKYRGMIHALRVIAKEEGRQGLYAGLGAHMAKTIPNAAILFFTYETVKRWAHRKDVERKAHPDAAK